MLWKCADVAHMLRRRSPVPMQGYILWTVLHLKSVRAAESESEILPPCTTCAEGDHLFQSVNSSICIRTLKKVYSVRSDVPRNSPTHTLKEITCSNASLHPSEQFYMIRTLKKVYSSCELKELTESCQLLKKDSESALEVRRCTTKLHMRRRRSPVPMQVYIPEQFYMHKNTSASVFIVWELKELTEYCQLLKKGSESALEVRRCTTKFYHLAHMRRRRSPVPMPSLHPSEQFYMH